MKIVVIGGTGLIGSKIVANLKSKGHDVVAASPSSGVNAVTGQGLDAALANAQVVVDVSNSPSFEDNAAMAFFHASARNLAAAEAKAGVRHHVALSVVGTERLQASGYFRAKLAQEELIKSSKTPYTIVRATQFFEFVGAVAQFSTDGQTVRLPGALVQPMQSDDVAAGVTTAATGQPVNGTIEIGGPEKFTLDGWVRTFLTATHDPRTVVQDASAPYFGIAVSERSLVPEDNARLGTSRFADWLAKNAKPAAR